MLHPVQKLMSFVTSQIGCSLFSSIIILVQYVIIYQPRIIQDRKLNFFFHTPEWIFLTCQQLKVYYSILQYSRASIIRGLIIRDPRLFAVILTCIFPPFYTGSNVNSDKSGLDYSRFSIIRGFQHQKLSSQKPRITEALLYTVVYIFILFSKLIIYLIRKKTVVYPKFV